METPSIKREYCPYCEHETNFNPVAHIYSMFLHYRCEKCSGWVDKAYLENVNVRKSFIEQVKKHKSTLAEKIEAA